MVIQWGKNPEYTAYAFVNLSYWALPLCIYWWGPHDVVTGIHFCISLKILCFGFEFEIWRWKVNKLTQEALKKYDVSIDYSIKELNNG